MKFVVTVEILKELVESWAGVDGVEVINIEEKSS
jgi:hypothetical protein